MVMSNKLCTKIMSIGLTMKPYQMDITQLVSTFSTNVQTGLVHQQVTQRMQMHGRNVLPAAKRASWLSIFISQFRSPLIYILLAAATIIFFVSDDTSDAFIISGILFFNAIIGTIQQGRAHSILEGLQQLIEVDCVIIRDGAALIVPDVDLVPGDIIMLQAGQRVPADARIVACNNVKVDESMLTGESVPVLKKTERLMSDVVLGDQINMVFKGTYIVSGIGKAVVVATGIHTQIGGIHSMSESIKTDIPLKKDIERLAYWILFLLLLLCIGLFIIGLAAGNAFKDLLIMLTALFICAIPEGLPVVVTLVLVSGAYRLARKNVLVKNLQGVEALGRTDALVIDKTGTLTRNEMMVSHVYADGKRYQVSGQGYHKQGEIYFENVVAPVENQSALAYIGIASCLLSNAEVTFESARGTFKIAGEPTEAALYVLSEKMGLVRDVLPYEKIYELLFDDAHKYHGGFFKTENQYVAFVIGSPEVLVGMAQGVGDNERRELQWLLDQGLRVVAFCMKVVVPDAMPASTLTEEQKIGAYRQLIATDLQFLGFCGIQDSIRSEVVSSIKQARDAGIHLIMATGDHKKTALFVAKNVGIYKEGDLVVDGSEFDVLSDGYLMNNIYTITVYSRMSAQQKMRVISLLHARGSMVAMTGDGINDAPALVTADLGIAMGGIGTEVAKQSADLVLLDDSLVNIVSAIAEGRHIFYTLRRVILYFFATNLGEIFIVLFALIMALPLPFTVAQILWLNFVTDGFLDSALAMEPHEQGLLRKKLTIKNKRLIDRTLFYKTLYMAVPMGLGSLYMFWWYCHIDLVYARTAALITMAMFQWFNAWNCRSEWLSVYQLGFFSNRWLIAATVFVLGLQFLLLYVPFMQHRFSTVPLAAYDWFLIIILAASIVVLEQIRKWYVGIKDGI
jgi:Ca2+-transporting ATPase